LAIYRCSRCGGFHIGQKRVTRVRVRPEVHESRCEGLNARPERGPLCSQDCLADEPLHRESRGTSP
jgi:hypothetical protein